MKIVVLDGFTLNPGDLSWNGLEALGACTVYDRTPVDAVVERGSDAEVILTNKTVLSAETLAALPHLRFIGVLATGYNVVDMKAAAERGITVSNVPAYGTQSVAQMVFAHLLNLTQNIGQHAREVSEGAWSESPDFCFWRTPQIELAGLTMGVIGFGRIGRATAHLAQAFDMKVMVHRMVGRGELPEGYVAAGLEQVFRECDVVSLHCPLTPETTEIVNAERIALMKPTAFLINTSRGPLIDEQALADALNKGMIAGAGLDVLSIEPPEPTNPLLTAKHCVITPHIAWATHAARERLLAVAVENVRAFQNGEPENVVSDQ